MDCRTRQLLLSPIGIVECRCEIHQGKKITFMTLSLVRIIRLLSKLALVEKITDFFNQSKFRKKSIEIMKLGDSVVYYSDSDVEYASD